MSNNEYRTGEKGKPKQKRMRVSQYTWDTPRPAGYCWAYLSYNRELLTVQTATSKAEPIVVLIKV